MVVDGYANAAVTAGQYLKEFVVPFACRIAAVMADAGGAGVGAGNTVIEVLKNGVTVFTTAANRPTLAAASTGAFANTQPDITALQPGDVLSIQIASIPATSGHTRVKTSVALALQ